MWAVLWVFLTVFRATRRAVSPATRTDDGRPGIGTRVKRGPLSPGLFAAAWSGRPLCLGGSGQGKRAHHKVPIPSGQAGKATEQGMQPALQMFHSACQSNSIHRRHAPVLTRPCVILLIMHISVLMAHAQTSTGQIAPNEKFLAAVIIRDSWGDRVCTGVVVHRLYILTSAQCVDATGDQPVILFPGVAADGTGKNGGRIPKVVQAKETHVHPTWQSGLSDGIDAALVRLKRSEPVDMYHPMIATAEHFFNFVYANVMVLVPTVDKESRGLLEIKELMVVQRDLCPSLNNLTEHTFCIHSSIDLKPEFLGAPVFFFPEGGMKMHVTEQNMIVGIASFYNGSMATKSSGLACVIVSEVLDWIKETIRETESQWKKGLSTALILINTFFPMFLVPYMLRDICRLARSGASQSSAIEHEEDTHGAFAQEPSWEEAEFKLDDSSPNDESPGQGGSGATVRIFRNKCLGRGRSGYVFKGIVVVVGAQPLRVAVKISRIAGLGKEYAILKKCQGHPNVLKCYGKGQLSDGTEFIVLELMDRNLKSLLQYHGIGNIRPLTYLNMVAIFRNIARGMQHLCECRIVHFDLKPSNVLVTEKEGSYIAKVADFDISKDCSRTDFTGHYQGTPGYVPPELCTSVYSDKKVIVNRMTLDTFSFGELMDCCIHEAGQIAGSEPRDSCIQDLRALIGKCRNGVPERRPSWKEADEALTGIIADLESSLA